MLDLNCHFIQQQQKILQSGAEENQIETLMTQLIITGNEMCDRKPRLRLGSKNLLWRETDSL